MASALVMIAGPEARAPAARVSHLYVAVVTSLPVNRAFRRADGFGTDRVAAVARSINVPVFVDLQGDEIPVDVGVEQAVDVPVNSSAFRPVHQQVLPIANPRHQLDALESLSQ